MDSVSETLEEVEIRAIRAFKEADRNGNNELQMDELEVALDLFFGPEDYNPEDLVKVVDVNGDGIIDIHEFTSALRRYVRGSLFLEPLKVTDERLDDAFHTLDTDGDGYIGKRELALLLERLNFIPPSATVPGSGEHINAQAIEVIDTYFQGVTQVDSVAFRGFARLLIDSLGDAEGGA
ncbi:hypothetical protein KIPB_006622 [Kipferlia bialata]|uniref:EF-hand domain-containing protein n=1 Tax=Kipferlia bialata TaxID=797122 RepID=A0A9K3GJZ0_9EUKA|nr:hypothetical protein KIPB_006622 [Kipferlia bialata]|eukprot:g6622.t1